MKKILCLLITVVMIVSLGVPAFAETSVSETTNEVSTTINEFEYMKDLCSLGATKLKNLGYTQEEISEITNYIEYFRNNVNSLSNLSIGTLINLGYSMKQISTIKNFHGTTMELASTSATVSFTSANVTNFGYKSSTTYTEGDISYSFSWSGVPAIKTTDIIAIAWNADFDMTSTSGIYYYYSQVTGKYSCFRKLNSGTSYSKGNDTSKSVGYGVSHVIQMTLNDNLYAKSGTGTVHVKTFSHGVKTDLKWIVSYGHRCLTIKPTVSPSFNILSSATASCGLGVSFSSGWTVMCTKSGKVICK